MAQSTVVFAQQPMQTGVITQAFCEICGKPIERTEMEGRCVGCNKLACKRCGRTCAQCGVILCIHHAKQCVVCGRFFCHNHIKEKDGNWYCKAHFPKSMCFIATASYGTPFAQEIDVLREWRDNSLMKTAHGRAFIKTYYTISPPIANFISKSEKRKAIMRKLLNPIVEHFKKKYECK